MDTPIRAAAEGVAHVRNTLLMKVIRIAFFLISPSKPSIFDLMPRKTQNPSRTDVHEPTRHYLSGTLAAQAAPLHLALADLWLGGVGFLSRRHKI